MSARLYHLRFDAGIGERWYLKPPLAATGEPFDFRRLFGGGPVNVAGGVFYPLSEPGPALDITLIDWDFLVTEEIAALIAALAPDDVQRIPACVESIEGDYEFLNVLARIDCVDWERTLAHVYVGDPPQLEKGTVASLEPFFDPGESLIGHVMHYDMKLNSEGIEGPRIFRVKRWDQWPVVTEEIKDALEERGASGVDYRLVS